ncbi:hypothetical protein ACFX2I_040194 [Malus domestica]
MEDFGAKTTEELQASCPDSGPGESPGFMPRFGTRELDVGSVAVRRDVEALPLEERVSLHAPVLINVIGELH